MGTARLPTDVVRGEQRVPQRGWVVGCPGKLDGFVGNAARLRIECGSHSGVAMDAASAASTSERNDRVARSRDATSGDASELNQVFASASRSVHSRSSVATRLPRECSPNPALATVTQSADAPPASATRR